MMTQIKTTEHAEQVEVVRWCREMAARGDHPWLGNIFAIANGAKLPYGKSKKGKRFAPQALRLLAEGMLPGVSDLFLPVPSQGFHGLFIELKVGYNRPTPEQKNFMQAMNAMGYLATACWGSEMAIRTIRLYLGIKGVSDGLYE